MYQNCEDPWLQSIKDNVLDSRRMIAKKWIKKISAKQQVRCCELGRGFGFITSDITKDLINCIGIDISPTAIKKAKTLHTENRFDFVDFDDFEFYSKEQINVFLMAEITWYVLPQLKSFLEKIKQLKKKRKSQYTSFIFVNLR